MTLAPHQILLVDDDRDLCSLLREYLESEGYQISLAHDGVEGVSMILANPSIDVVVLDIMMPGLTGLDVLQQVRKAQCNTAIIMLTGRGDDVDRIVGLEMGADDYLAKPCNPRELVARIRAVLRRTKQPASEPEKTVEVLSLHGIHMNTASLSITVNGEPVELTGAEFSLLSLLMASCGTTLSKEWLTEQVLHRKLSAYDRSIDVHVSRVRQKLGAYGVDPGIIKAIRGVGYQMIKEVEGEA